MIRDFDKWTANFGEVADINDLRGLRIGIDAADYINTRIFNGPATKEPLVPALGGLPLALKQHLEADLKHFKKHDLEPFFVFNGLDVVKPDDPFRQRQLGAEVNLLAWNLYDSHQADQSVAKFGESTYTTPEDLFRALQSFLIANGIQFLVAPYSAWAQLAYLQKSNNIQAISGSSEILLFDCDHIITSWDFENGQISFVRKANCVADLRKAAGNGTVISDDQFVDACMLAGNHFLPTIPTLESPQRKHMYKPVGAIDIMMNAGRSGISVVLNNQDDPRFQRMDYVDRYRRARLAVKHQPIITIDGKIKPLAQETLPSDSHAFIGQQLPAELYFYFSRGLINARILTWRTTSEIIEAPPADGGNSDEYKRLVDDKLNSLRTTSINLLSSSLHNWFQHKDIILRCWFADGQGRPKTTTLSMGGDATRDTRVKVETWCVNQTILDDTISRNRPSGQTGAHLTSAILALQDPGFASSTIGKTSANNTLSTEDEIITNAIWRFMALRDYVDTKHNLTPWGKVLATVINRVKGRPELEEAAVIAVELLRLGILTSRNMFPEYNGAPLRGDSKNRENNLLISRVAGLGVLHHKPIGFTGPLSQHLLGYNSMIEAVRSSLRDMVEVCATQMFTTNCVQREFPSLSEVSMHLPFLLPNNCALSIAVKSYLDELLTNAEPTNDKVKLDVMTTAATRYFPQSVNLDIDIHTAFELWDAVYAGVEEASSSGLIIEKDRKQWAEADEWLAPRR